MLQGWFLTGNSKKGLELKKDGSTIRFDIKVEMVRGMIYAGYFWRYNELVALKTDCQDT